MSVSAPAHCRVEAVMASTATFGVTPLLPVVRLADLESVAGQPLVVDAREPLEVVVHQFESSPRLSGAMIHRSGTFACVISRRDLANRMSRGFFRELFVKRPIEYMLSVWEQNTLELPVKSLVTDAVARALARDAELRYEPVVAVRDDGGRFLVDMFLLLTEQGRILSNAVTELESQRQVILHAEREKEVLHERIVAASRHAGMAEIATSVLHNVGNVLNSVNVSAAVLQKKLEELKVANLGKAAEMMQSQGEQLPQFLQSDERGKQLPQYLTKLAGVFAVEQKSMLEEVSALGRSIEHIQHIVSAQQQYARGGLVVEVIDLPDLVQDALRINQIALERHGVQVNVELDHCPSVVADKHRVMQILVNLISNAKKAVRDGGKLDRLITIRARLDDSVAPAMVELAVIDNGVGISPENLPKIFNHGFTTRTDGHGFGLHSAANDASQMGGSLRAVSDGPGQGAAFLLRLPTDPAKIAAPAVTIQEPEAAHS